MVSRGQPVELSESPIVNHAPCSAQSRPGDQDAKCFPLWKELGACLLVSHSCVPQNLAQGLSESQTVKSPSSSRRVPQTP